MGKHLASEAKGGVQATAEPWPYGCTTGMMSAVKAWILARPWWQELLILWLLYSVAVLGASAVADIALGWTDLLPGDPYAFLICTLAWAAAFTVFMRRQRRRSSALSSEAQR
ncbi:MULTISPECIES: hypothetical protein [Streptacidiphilus]|uniref:Uncharacterized protein n=1 Tax=Streptacidiphilus cavernicola TaxID=3342716 RepID=A0ABV6URX0_9ACTN|nr:hypothetical protein [Streptacidiphilus jeojiense]